MADKKSGKKKDVGKIVALTRLSDRRRAEVRALEANCRAYDGTEAVAELGNELNFSRRLRCFFLYYGNDGELQGFLSVFCPDGEYAEIIAFVEPGHRRCGVFKALLKEAKRELKENGIRKILFVAEPAAKDVTVVAKRLGVQLKYSELLMRLDGDRDKEKKANETGELNKRKCENGQKAKVLKSAEHPDTEVDVNIEIPGSEDTENVDREYVFSTDDFEFGYAGVYLSGGTAFIHHVEVYEAYRGRGLGKALMRNLLKSLKNELPGCTIRLQVTSTNLPAVHIYRDLGFVVESQRDYYE